jgi:hypothetical protein
MQQEQEPEERRQEPRRLDSARDCAKDFIRAYVLDGWTLKEITDGHQGANYQAYAAQIGSIEDYQGRQHSVRRSQLAISRVGAAPCWGLFDIADLMAEIRDEQRGYEQQSLAAIFVQQEEQDRIAAQAEQDDPEAQRQQAPRKRPAVYRSYMGGSCKHCGEWLGHIETDGGRDREFCDNNGKCRQAHHRQKKREEKRAAILQHHGSLRDYWQQHNIHGEPLARLQEILIRHGKEAARAATDAVIIAVAAQAQAGSQEQFKLMNEIMLRGEALNFPEVQLDEFRISPGVRCWTDFVSCTTLSLLRQMRGYLSDLQQREQQKAQARQRLEALSQEPQQPAGQA